LKNVEPQLALIRFLYDDRQPRTELASRPRPGAGPVIARDSTRRPQQLRPNQPGQVAVSKLKADADYIQGKLPSPRSQLIR